jgi:hypothetical protein
MAERYSDRIEDYCRAHGIDVPPGFRRHPASRYAAIDLGRAPPRLIATTWFKQEDLLYYVSRHASPAVLRLLDFKERQELAFEAGSLRSTGQSF